MNEEIKKNLFNVLADCINYEELNYHSFKECKLCIKKQNSQYLF